MGTQGFGCKMLRGFCDELPGSLMRVLRIVGRFLRVEGIRRLSNG